MEKENNTSLVVDKILKSQPFTNKEVLKGLLVYLYEAGKKGLVLKEADIALDFFKRGNDFIPGDDTIVRVNIHKLRSLLEGYYLTEGKKDPLVLEIPKGSYTIKFVKRGSATTLKTGRNNTIKVVYIALAISSLINLFFLFKSGVFHKTLNNPVWTSYIESGQPVNIVLGDPFFFRINDSIPVTVIVRDISINSRDELKNFNQGYFNPQKPKVAQLTYPYFSTNNVWPLPDVISVFAKANIRIRLQALSDMNVEDIKRNNNIIIGNINSFGYINRFMEQTSIRLHTNPRQIIIKKAPDSIVMSVPEFIHGYYMDYAFLVKIPGPQNNIITIMGDFHASGIKGLTNYITSKSTLTELEAKVEKDYGKFPEYFEMVVKVTSYNYADFKTELIYFKPL
jgi:hypothetical protein